MPRDVAMEEPDTWVVGLEGDEQEATAGKVDGVTALGVDTVDGTSVIGKAAETRRKSVEVVTVEMDGVGNRDSLLDGDVHPLLSGALKIIRDVEGDHLGGESGVGVGDELTDTGVGLGSTEGLSTNLPRGNAIDGSDRGGEMLLEVGVVNVVVVVRNKVVNILLDALVDLSTGIGRGGGHLGAGGVLVVADDSVDLEGRANIGTTAGGDGIRAHPVVVRLLVGLDNDLISLAGGEEDVVGNKGLDRNPIHGDDSELVTVDAEAERDLSSGVDETHEMLLSSLELGLKARALALVHVATVDDTVTDRIEWGASRKAVSNDGGRLMVPIGQHDGTKIDVVVGGLGAVDDNRTNDTIGVLHAVVGVVPGETMLSGSPAVGERISRSNGALGERGGTISEHGSELTNTVPVDTGAVVLQLIGHLDDDLVTPVGLDGGSGILSVHNQNVALNSIGSKSDVLDAEVEVTSLSGVGPRVVRVGINREFRFAVTLGLGPAVTRVRGVSVRTRHGSVVAIASVSVARVLVGIIVGRIFSVSTISRSICRLSISTAGSIGPAHRRRIAVVDRRVLGIAGRSRGIGIVIVTAGDIASGRLSASITIIGVIRVVGV